MLLNLLPWLNLLAALPLLGIAWSACRLTTRQARSTTLVRPLWWLAAAILCWIGAQLVAVPALKLSPAAISRIGFLSLTLLLAPFVSVLGAKRPGARVWDLFVVMPMLVVINWPAWAAILTGSSDQIVDLEGPGLAGLVVVTLMITGNYFGTAFTGPVLLFAAGILVGATSYSSLLPVLGDGRLSPRIVTSLCIGAALFLAMRGATSRSQTRNGYNGAWLEFRDWFGILWAKRLMDRLNQTAEQNQWALRVSLDGLHWLENASPQQREQSVQDFERTFRWLLRRFADDSWLDRRINPPHIPRAHE